VYRSRCLLDVGCSSRKSRLFSAANTEIFEEEHVADFGKFGQEGPLSSAEYYLADSAGDSFSPAVNPRIKELIPFGQPKGCERFRVRIISRPGRRGRGGETGQKGKESVTGRKNRREDEGRGPGMTSRKAREADRERERERERERGGGRRGEREPGRVGELERDRTRLDVRSAGNKDNSMQ